MQDLTVTKQISQFAVVALAIWALIAAFGRLIEWRGPSYFWEVFSGMNGMEKVLVIPIPDFLGDFLFEFRFQWFTIAFLLTVALVGVAAAYLASDDEKFLLIMLVLAVLHVLAKLQLFIDGVSSDFYRDTYGVLEIFRSSALGLIVPLAGALALGAVLLGKKGPISGL